MRVFMVGVKLHTVPRPSERSMAGICRPVGRVCDVVKGIFNPTAALVRLATTGSVGAPPTAVLQWNFGTFQALEGRGAAPSDGG